jgi:hypothetical protein
MGAPPAMKARMIISRVDDDELPVVAEHESTCRLV